MHEDGLTKSIWTHADFDVMGWHDAQLYCFTVLPESFEFVMDLDYIAKWIHPVPPEKYFSFYVSPATLVFHNAQNISVTLEMSTLADVEVLDIKRVPVESGVGWRWTIELDCGEIALDASGYTQYVRQRPLLNSNQHLGLESRGGISYARTAFNRS